MSNRGLAVTVFDSVRSRLHTFESVEFEPRLGLTDLHGHP